MFWIDNKDWVVKLFSASSIFNIESKCYFFNFEIVNFIKLIFIYFFKEKKYFILPFPLSALDPEMGALYKLISPSTVLIFIFSLSIFFSIKDSKFHNKISVKKSLLIIL